MTIHRTDVVVVLGPGQIGQAIARRVGIGKTVVLADRNPANAEAAAKTLADVGYRARAETVDIADREAVRRLAALATELGDVTGVIHAAGVSPSQAPPETVLRVDLYGTALLLEEFGAVIARGGSGVVIASQFRLPAAAAPRRRSDPRSLPPLMQPPNHRRTHHRGVLR